MNTIMPIQNGRSTRHLNPALFQSFIAIIFLCFWKKAMRETSEGTDLLLDVSCSLDGHFGHYTSLYQNFRTWFPIREIRESFILQKFVCIQYYHCAIWRGYCRGCYVALITTLWTRIGWDFTLCSSMACSARGDHLFCWSYQLALGVLRI